MNKITITAKAPRKARRAVELFSSECNFRPKTVPNKRAYSRKTKYRRQESD